MNINEIIYELDTHVPETISEHKLVKLIILMAEMIRELQIKVNELERINSNFKDVEYPETDVF